MPIGVDSGACLADCIGGRVASRVGTGWRDGVDLSRECVEVGESADRVSVNGNQAVVVRVFEIFVDNATTENNIHLRSVESSNFSKHSSSCSTTLRVATIFGEEDWNRVVGKFCNPLVIA